MSETLIEFACRLHQQPWNRPCSDKTWVLHAHWQHRKFSDEVRSAVGVAAR